MLVIVDNVCFAKIKNLGLTIPMYSFIYISYCSMLEPGIICFYVFLNHISSLKQQQQKKKSLICV